MSQNFLFLTFIIVITSGLVIVAQTAREMFGDAVFLRLEKQKLQAQLARSELNEKVLTQQFFDYGQNVAAILGPQEKKLKEWSSLNLLYVSRIPASTENASESLLLLAKGKAYFSEGKFAEAILAFSDLEKKFPGSPAVIESRFLKTESYYLQGQLDQCLESIEDMMSFYPEHPMTGYLMLRLSQILQYRKRTSEALDVLRMIQSNFASEVELSNQAGQLEKKYRIL